MKKDKSKKGETPKLDQKKMDPKTFGSTFGIVVWLMTMDKRYADVLVKELEKKILPAILLQQFKLYSKKSQPVAFLTWAAVSDEIKVKIDKGNTELELTDWRSGNNMTVLDCVSPFADHQVFIDEFWKGVKDGGNG
ncbi:MAG: toxin-activating lysine-acyltransferase [Pseudomonadota bacterium]